MRLIDADALLSKFNKKADIWTALTDEKTANDFALYCKVADAVEEIPTVGGWVSVKDRLPENGAFVAVQHKVNDSVYTEVAHYLMGRWWLDWDTNGSELNAICWMPLPEPPEVTE